MAVGPLPLVASRLPKPQAALARRAAAEGASARAIASARERVFTLSSVPKSKHAVVIFGHGEAGVPSPTPQLVRRLERGLAELQKDPEALAVLSGDAVHTRAVEADVMRAWLIARGVDAQRIVSKRIVTETTAQSTLDNAQFVAPILERAGVERVTLVTERFHMRRSRSLLKRAMRRHGLGRVRLRKATAPDALTGRARWQASGNEVKALVRDQVRFRGVERSRPFIEADFKVPVVKSRTAEETAKRVAQEIAQVIRDKHEDGGAVLGLATGSTPLAVYRELIRMHREEGLDFSRVKTFNLDEYYGLKPDDPNSYHHYMHENLFRHLSVPGRALDLQNAHVPPGDLPKSQVARATQAYERAIAEAGGLDVQLLGIGGTGHVGFNEPGSARGSRTRLVQLADKTRTDAAPAFGGKENVPTEAISMGVGTILDAKKLILMSTGEHKADITRRAVEGRVTEDVPATFLQDHPDATFFVDEAAAGRLARAVPPSLRPVGREGRKLTALLAHQALLPGPEGQLVRQRALILFRGGDIERVVVDPKPRDIPAKTRRVNGVVAPGFIDLQNNGSYGGDVARHPKRAMELLARRMPEQGVTSVLPTVVSSPTETLGRVFDAVDTVKDLPGADIVGVHAEGPFFNPRRKGAHDPKHLRPVDLGALRSMIERSQGKLKLVTLAPELPRALEAIRLSLEHGVVPSAGHTDAGRAEMLAALERTELRMVTHATNAMSKDLKTGPMGAAAQHPEAKAGVIADLIHVEPALLAALYEQLGPDRMFLVTDAAPPAGMPDGRYTLGGMSVEKRAGAVRLSGEDTLAGSALTMDRAVRNMTSLRVSLEDAVRMASQTPAKALGLQDRGTIAAGQRADLVILSPKGLSVRETIIGGVTRFDARARSSR